MQNELGPLANEEYGALLEDLVSSCDVKDSAAKYAELSQVHEENNAYSAIQWEDEAAYLLHDELPEETNDSKANETKFELAVFPCV